MKVKQHFIFISNSNCHQNNGKLCSTVFWLIKWRQACCITNVNSTENIFSENTSKLPCLALAPDEGIHH